MPTNWNTQGPRAMDDFFRFWEMGQKMGASAREAMDRRELRSALASVAANPEDTKAIGSVFERDANLGLKLFERADERKFQSALGDYLKGSPMAGAGRNALLPPSDPAPAGNMPMTGPDATGPMPGAISGYSGGTFDLAGRQVTPVGPPPADGDPRPPYPQGATLGDATGTNAQTPPAQPDPKPDFSFLGKPQSGRDQAFLAMLQRDPIKAMKIQSTLRDNFIGKLKSEHGFYGLAVEELGRVQDDAGWQTALGRLQPYADEIGVDLGETVPLTYPGPDQVRALMERALPLKERLDYLMRAANNDADNERADRNTDSLISSREDTLAERRRSNSERIAATRRGQDMRSGDTRRGQDLRPAPHGRAAPASGGAGRANIPTVKSAAEAMKLPSGTTFRTPDGLIKVRP